MRFVLLSYAKGLVPGSWLLRLGLHDCIGGHRRHPATLDTADPAGRLPKPCSSKAF